MSSRSERLERGATLYDDAAEQLELAAKHCRTAAGHFRDGEIPRASAHAWAAHGHALEAQERLSSQAREHAERSLP